MLLKQKFVERQQINFTVVYLHSGVDVYFADCYLHIRTKNFVVLSFSKYL